MYIKKENTSFSAVVVAREARSEKQRWAILDICREINAWWGERQERRQDMTVPYSAREKVWNRQQLSSEEAAWIGKAQDY